MIGTAFYALGVIACMILIVIAAIAFLGAAVAFYRVVAPLLSFLALAALAWWLGAGEIVWLRGREIPWLGMFAVIIGGIWWLIVKNEDQQSKDTTRAQQDRWKALDKSWWDA